MKRASWILLLGIVLCGCSGEDLLDRALEFRTRMLAASGLISLGGLCVGMQTVSVTEGLGLGSYIPGKLLQTALSLTLTGVYLWGGWTGLLGLTALFWLICKKDVAFSCKPVYNKRNLTR